MRALLDEQGIKADVFDGVEVEPTDRSMEEAADYARTKEVDGFVAVGGGSAIDTGKAVNLLTCYPAPLLDYVNKPVGRGVPVPGPLKPLIAMPTTAGTGSETTAVARDPRGRPARRRPASRTGSCARRSAWWTR